MKEYRDLICRGAGDRIESHTMTHVDGEGTIDHLREYVESKRIIQAAFGCEHGTTLTYPRGRTQHAARTKDVIAQTYIGARSTRLGLYRRGDDTMALPCMAVEDLTRGDLQAAMQAGAAIIGYGHGVEGTSGWRPIPPARLLAHMADLKALEESIWFTSLPELLKYLQATGQAPRPPKALWDCPSGRPNLTCTEQ
jgi:hypothetical protein